MNISTFWIGGKQNVISVLNENICLEVLIDEKRKDIKNYKIFNKVKFVSKKLIDKKFFNLPGYNHQGFAAYIKYENIYEINEFFKLKKNTDIIALDDLQDIGNYGTIIRSCVAFGINTILLNKNKLTKKLPIIFKNSAGSFKDINIIYTSNIFNEIIKFQKNNFSVISLDTKTNNSLKKFKWSDKNLIILGSEDKGIKKNILKKSDYIIKIEIEKNSESLNVAQAASICMYDLVSKRNKLI